MHLLSERTPVPALPPPDFDRYVPPVASPSPEIVPAPGGPLLLLGIAPLLIAHLNRGDVRARRSRRARLDHPTPA